MDRISHLKKLDQNKIEEQVQIIFVTDLFFAQIAIKNIY